MKTKESIDKHAKLVLSQAGGKDGKHSFNLARLYFEAHCYEEAKTYINSFLQSVGNSDWRAHKLLADIELAEGCEQDALHTYKDVLRLQPDCRDALMKVALLAAKLNPMEQAEKWLKEVERRYPCEAKVTEIRDIVSSRKSGDHLSEMRQKSTKHPTDIDAQCQYLNELINCGQNRQAFDHVVERVGMFNSSLQWQRTSEMVLENFMATSPSTDREQIGNFMILATYYRQILLTVATAPLNTTKQLIQKLDRGLYRFVSGYEINRLDDSSELNCCAKEIAACLLTATVLVINKILLQRTFSLSSVDILIMSLCKAGLALQPHKLNFQWVSSSFSFNVEGTSTCASPHYEQSSRTVWNVLATERMTLLSHVLSAVRSVQRIDPSLFNSCKLSGVKDQLINIVYSATTVTNSSFVANYLYLLEPFYPNLNEIDHSYQLSTNDVHVRDFFKQTCESMENVCWIILSRSGFPKCDNVGNESLRWMLSDKLPLSVEMNTNRVSNVDLQAFALAASYWMGQHLKYYNKVNPFLPSISLLCSVASSEQVEGWRALLDVAVVEKNFPVKGYATSGRHLNQSLQIIRANVSGLPTAIQIALARSFQKLSESSGDSTWTDIYKQRSVHYWEKVLPSIKHLCRGQSNIVDVEQERNNKLFPVAVLPTLKPEEAKKCLDEGSMFVATWYRTQGNLDASLNCLQKTESVILSPQSALMKAEVLQDKSLVESNEDRETQRELLTTSFGEISSILKRKDLPVAVKKEAHKQLNSVVNKLTELDRLAEVEANEAAAAIADNSSIGQRNGASAAQSSEISNKLDSVSGELSSLNTNIQAMTDQLKHMHATWDQGLKEMTQNVKKLIDIQLTMQQRPVNPPVHQQTAVLQPAGQQMFIRNPMIVPGPQHQVPTLSQNPNPVVSGVYAPPGTQGQFLAPPQGSIAPTPGFQFRPPGAPTSMPNGMSFPTTSDVVPIPAQMPVPQNPSLFGQPVPQTVVRQPVQPVYPIKQVPPEGENFQATPNPMLSALLRAPNSHVEQKLNQPFQPPKMLSSVEHAQDSVPSSAKEPNPIPTLGASPNVLTSTPKVLGNKVAVIAAPKANVPGPVLPNAPSSLISQDGSSSVNSKKSLFSNIAAPKIDNVPPVSEPVPASTVTPQFSTLFGVKTTQSGQVPTTSSQLGFSFSSQLKPTGTSSTVPSSAFSFKMAPPVVTFATPASVFSPSTASNTISGQPSAAVFTGFKGFQAPVSNLSQPEAQSQAKSKTAFSLVGGAANSKPTSLLSEVPSKTSPQKSQDNKNETSMSNKGLGTLGSGSSFSFKFNMAAPPTAEIGKSPGKITNTPEKPSNTSGSALVVPGNGTTNSTTIASPGGNKEADDSTHDPQFEPIVHLDKVVDLKTGEESEIEMFCERAKLRRFVDGEWKERGVGDMKVLKSQSDSGKAEKYRVVMRREQVKKLCANHVITDEMTIQVHPTNDKSLIWIANDFAEEEEVLEKLCVRFKTADVAAKFKNVFEEGVTVYGKANSSEVKSFAKPETSEKQPVVKETQSVKENVSESRVKKGDASKSSDEKPKIEQEERKPKKETVVETIGPTESSNTKYDHRKQRRSQEKQDSLASKFGLKSGQWNCDACLTQNKADVTRCAACDGPKDPKAVGTTTIAPVVASDAFGGGSKGPVFKFDTSKTSAGAFKFGVSSNAQTSSFKFGVTPSVATKPEDKTATDEEKEKPSIFEGFKGFGLKSAATNSSTPLFGAPAFQPVSSSNVSHDLSKSSVITTTTASLFGTATENAKPTVANSIFGSQSSGTSSIFGSSSATLSTSGIFGKTAATEVSSNAAPAPESNSIFGKSAAPASSGIFGKSSGTAPVSSGGMVFGKGAGDGTGSKFGQSVFEKPRAELQTADDLTKEASEKCGVTFETEAEDDERYYCEEDDGEYEEGEGYYPGDEYYGDGEDEEYVYGDNYEEPEEGEIFGYDEEGQLTDLDHVQNTPMRMTAGRLGPSKPGQFMSPMARFDPNESAGTPPQVTSVFGTKPPALVNPIAKVPVASTAEDFEKLDDEINDDEEEEIDIVYERASDENPEHRSLVEQYRLPPLFYDSLSKPECSGCIGCDDDPNLTNRKIYKDDTTAKVTLKPEVEAQRIAESGTSKEASQSLDASKTSGFLFGTQVQSGFSFASLASNAADQGGAFGQGSSTGKSTTFTAKPLFAGLNLGGDTTSESTTNPIASENPEEQEECDIHFKPIVQLEKVDTKSGEEDSEIIFCERAKLYRFTDGEWKERGVGEIKVLRYIPKNVGRIVMRRDVILKLCANHVIFKDMSLAPMNASGKSFVWAATDFADDAEGSLEKFAVRFKNPELASKFEECFNKMRELVHVE